MTIIRSPKHPNWQMWKEYCYNPDTKTHHIFGYIMEHDTYDGYLIQVCQIEAGEGLGEWYGQILTEQKIEDFDGTEWLPAQNNPFWGPIAEAKAEVIRRGKYWANNLALLKH